MIDQGSTELENFFNTIFPKHFLKLLPLCGNEIFKNTFLFYIGIEPINNVVIVSDAQQVIFRSIQDLSKFL